ncbi:uncharacterized protein O3C94_004922 [Discoglossus pictus]
MDLVNPLVGEVTKGDPYTSSTPAAEDNLSGSGPWRYEEPFKDSESELKMDHSDPEDTMKVDVYPIHDLSGEEPALELDQSEHGFNEDVIDNLYSEAACEQETTSGNDSDATVDNLILQFEKKMVLSNETQSSEGETEEGPEADRMDELKLQPPDIFETEKVDIETVKQQVLTKITFSFSDVEATEICQKVPNDSGFVCESEIGGLQQDAVCVETKDLEMADQTVYTSSDEGLHAECYSDDYESESECPEIVAERNVCSSDANDLDNPDAFEYTEGSMLMGSIEDVLQKDIYPPKTGDSENLDDPVSTLYTAYQVLVDSTEEESTCDVFPEADDLEVAGIKEFQDSEHKTEDMYEGLTEDADPNDQECLPSVDITENDGVCLPEAGDLINLEDEGEH